jgi:hypothetical protein
VVGALSDLAGMLAGEAGTRIAQDVPGIVLRGGSGPG